MLGDKKMNLLASSQISSPLVWGAFKKKSRGAVDILPRSCAVEASIGGYE